MKGYTVVVYDAYPQPGGLLIYGIPGFKLEKHVVERRINFLRDIGVQFVCSTRIGKDLSLTDLRKQGFAAIFLGYGAMSAKESGLEGADHARVLDAIPFIIGHNLGEPYVYGSHSKIDVSGKRVVVLGGGDTAMDCVRTAKRAGAAKVTCVYRRDEESMPGSRREIKAARQEGVEFQFLAQPKQVLVQGDGIQGVECLRTQLEPVENAGERKRTKTLPESEFMIEADYVVIAFGFDPADIEADADPRLARKSWGGLQVNDQFETSWPGVFAGGDSVRGADLIVTAMADGRKAASAMDKFLETQAPK